MNLLELKFSKNPKGFIKNKQFFLYEIEKMLINEACYLCYPKPIRYCGGEFEKYFKNSICKEEWKNFWKINKEKLLSLYEEKLNFIKNN